MRRRRAPGLPPRCRRPSFRRPCSPAASPIQANACYQAVPVLRRKARQTKSSRVRPVPVRSRFAQQPRRLQAYRRPGSVVVRPRSVRLGSITFEGRESKCPDDNKNRLGQLGIANPEESVHIFQVDGFLRGPLGRHFELIHHHLQFPSGILRNFVESSHDAVAPAANPPLRVRPTKKASAAFRSRPVHESTPASLFHPRSVARSLPLAAPTASAAASPAPAPPDRAARLAAPTRASPSARVPRTLQPKSSRSTCKFCLNRSSCLFSPANDAL